MLGHFDEHVGRGGQDHRSVRMIEQPLPLVSALSSLDNTKEVLRRLKRQVERSQNFKNDWVVDARQFKDFFKFSIVRNPWARAFSWYENVMRAEVHQKTLDVRPDMPFDEFLAARIGTGMLRPQTYWLKNFRGEIDLDFVGRFETLHEDLAHVASRLSLGNYELPRKLTGKGTDYRKAYSDTSRYLVEITYAEEIERFGYSFENG